METHVIGRPSATPTPPKFPSSRFHAAPSTAHRCHFLPEVVGDDNDTTAEGVDGIGQRVDGGDIKTVGGLVEQEHVGALNGEQGENDTGLLSVGQGADQRGLGLTGQTVATKLLAPVLVVLGLLRVLLTDEVESGLGQIELLGAVLGVQAKLQVGVAGDGTVGRGELARHQTKQGGLANTVGADEGGTGVHVETEVDVAVQVVLGIARVGEGDVVERQDGRGELLDICETEGEDLVRDDGLDKTIGLHLVKNLLTGFCLSDQVGVGTGAGNELLDVNNLILLLLVGLHLVGLLLGASPVVDVVVATVVQELLQAHVDHGGAHAVKEIHGVGDEDEGTVPLLEVLFQPHAGLEIQMGSGVVEQQQRRSDEQGLGESDTHSPSTGHVLGLLVNGDLVETQTRQDERGAGGKGRGVHLLHVLQGCQTFESAARGQRENTYLVQVHQDRALGAIIFEDLLGQLVQTGHLTLSLGNDPLKGTELGGRSTLVQKVDIDVFGDGELARIDGLEKGRLSATVLSQETVAATVRELEGGVVEEDTAVEHQAGTGDLDVLAGLGRSQDTGGDTVRDAVLVHLGGETAHLVHLIGAGGGAIVAVGGLLLVDLASGGLLGESLLLG
ncbi:hypothetical protein CTA1_9472 [Colletotrichum tanaceti]|uniref:NAD-specific glutamate dehydrogenase n=1 Tax=Colletotrichum tanaceti TaxID=1306861 RepID=A0A4U6X6W5_9PEZI|nr:hypothetical protein CTA1_9472 [Colletotrichum tanaceti]